ncbi:unnamed protein product [Litomosoides sigmodontis]|uniref:Uncharacterized protein n=1 Tax=Litomosoides sigmodontis TaxID=42156 RepID=A0A3P6SHD9_LITSI|nr:unnamed protein product [Litomosoides sigmodontis]
MRPMDCECAQCAAADRSRYSARIRCLSLRSVTVVHEHFMDKRILWLNSPNRSNNSVASALLTAAVLYSTLTIIHSQQQRKINLSDDDNLYILIDEINVYTCRGVKNEIKLTEDDINIVNEKGNRVYFIKAPGSYSLQFKKLIVTKDIGYLSGEIGVTLQVPIIEGPAGIRFDLPYTVIPETGILDQECDKYSGVVERGNRQYCRYCDICGLTAKLETDLNDKGHLFLPEVARGTEEKFAPICNRIASNIYAFNRTINLPGRRELEVLINEKVEGLDSEIRQRLNKKRGRLQVFLNLISAEQPAMKEDDWFAKIASCRCCWDGRGGSCHGVLSFLYCNKEECKNNWAQRCLHHTARIIACYTVEFNYHTTTSFADVIQFLNENNYPNQETVAAVPEIQTSPHLSDIDEVKNNIVQTLTERCVAKMPQRLTHLRRYCVIFWNDKLCCSHCPDVCQS